MRACCRDEPAGSLMKILKIVGFGAALAFASSGAGAFQEQKSGGAAVPVAADAQTAPQTAPSKDLGLAADTAPKSSTGTEVRIPGLGKLGVLPKMDFGLELLYGAADQAKQPEPPRGTAPGEDDLTIRGTVKHRW